MVEVKRKTEEMKMEIMSLGSQKAELNSKVLDMESTISSLREEQRAVEMAFQEKQNEVKMLRDKDQDPQVEALMEELRHKEAENEDLKHRLQLRGAEVAHERLILPSNTTAENQGGDVQDGERKNAGETESIDRSSENGGTDADGRSEKKVDQERERGEKEEHEDDEAPVTARGESRDSQETEEVHGGRVKLEMQENTHRVRGKRGYLRRAKAKRWRSIAKQTQGKRTSPGNASASTMADQALVRGDKLPDAGRGEGEATLNVGSYSEENNGEPGEKRPPGNELRGSLQRDETEDLSRNDPKNSTSEETHVSLEELAKKPANKNADDRNEQQHTDLLRRKEGKPDAEESELGEDSEEKEETDEQEF